MLNGGELVGQTVIDIEDRFYSNCYATCGLPQKYNVSGYNAWRDCLLPRQLLGKMCKKFSLQKPKYVDSKLEIYDLKGILIWEFEHSEDANHYIESSSSSELDSSETDNEHENEGESLVKKKTKPTRINKVLEQLALDALNNWEKIANVALVPEHLETRSLYNPDTGFDLEQGNL